MCESESGFESELFKLDSDGFGFKVPGFSFQTGLLALSSSISISNVSISKHRQKCAIGPSLYSGVLHNEVKALAYIKMGRTPIHVLPVPNAYTTCCDKTSKKHC